MYTSISKLQKKLKNLLILHPTYLIQWARNDVDTSSLNSVATHDDDGPHSSLFNIPGKVALHLRTVTKKAYAV